MVDAHALLDGVTCGLVLGSGIRVLEDLEDRVDVSYGQLPGMPEVTVAGHQGVLTVGTVPGDVPVKVAIARGRFHLYEGHEVATATSIVRLFADSGVPRVVLTNAAGGLVADWTPGDLMIVDDHLNFMGVREGGPAAADEAGCERGSRFTCSVGEAPLGVPSPYTSAWADAAARAADGLGLKVRRGVYVGLLGPSYETPAELRWLARVGAQAVGMSTVPEALHAASRGLQVLGISCITNIAATTEGQANTSHQEVVDVAAMASAALDGLLRHTLQGPTT